MMGCNQSYYRINDDPESEDPCEDILKQTSIEIYNGPMRKLKCSKGFSQFILNRCSLRFKKFLFDGYY